MINEEKSVKHMTTAKMLDYLVDNGRKIVEKAFAKVKDNFFKTSTSLTVNNNDRQKERTELESLGTISDVQEKERKLDEQLNAIEKEIESAPETSLNPANGPKLKGAKVQNFNALKKYKERLQPVLDVLKLKLKAANTFTTIQPLYNSYTKLEETKGKNDPEVKRQAVVLSTSYKQYSNEIKEVLDGASKILPKDAELKKDLDDMVLIVNTMEKEASPVSILHSNMKTPVLNRTKKDGPIDVSVRTKDGSTVSYRLDQGNFSKLDTVIRDDELVETKFKQAVESSKEGTKVVKMTYKGEPLIVSLNISHPHDSKEKAKQNMNTSLKKETERIVSPENLKKLSLEQLQSAQQQIEKEIAFVNSNTKVLPENKEKLKTVMRESHLVPTQREIAQRHLNNPSKGGRKTKRNHSKKGTRKQTTRRSS